MYCTTKGSKKEYCKNINVNLNEKKKTSSILRKNILGWKIYFLMYNNNNWSIKFFFENKKAKSKLKFIYLFSNKLEKFDLYLPKNNKPKERYSWKQSMK